MATYKICFIDNKILQDQHTIQRFYTYNLKNNYTVLECLNKYENHNRYGDIDIDSYKNRDLTGDLTGDGQSINTYDKEKEETTYIVINNNYVAHYNEKINTILHKLQTRTLTIERITKLKGGGGLGGMFESILQIGTVFMFLIDLVIWFGKFIIWFIFFIAWLIKYLLIDLLTDFSNGILVIIISICKFPLDICISLIAYFTNSIGGWMTTIWGWDQSNLTKKDRNSNYFKNIDRKKGKKCFLTNTNTVPFSILLGTILCPPLGVFMNLGLTGWFNILICILLTLCYYLPGLFYALLVIYA